MPTLDVFKADAFSMTSLTAAIQALPYAPTRLGEMNLFTPKPVATTVAMIEIEDGVLSLIPTSPRGGAPTVHRSGSRKVVTIQIPKIELIDTIKADDVVNIRAFGSETELQTVEKLVNSRMESMNQAIEVTQEYHRIGAVTGIVLDADGETALVNLFDLFGVSEQSVSFALDTATTDVREKCLDVSQAVEDALGMAVYDHVHAVCGKNFFRALISHDSVKDAYHRYQDSIQLRNDPRAGFEYGGIIFEEYRGKIGSLDFINADNARFFPIGVQDLFQVAYAPGDFMETVGTLGQPMYAKQKLLDFDKGVELLAQTNPLHICTRPRVLVKGIK